MIQQFHSWVYIQKKMKTLIRKYICTPMSIAALFTIAKTWKQPKRPSIEDVNYIYNGLLLSHKKEQNNAICGNMDGLGGYYA